MTTFGGYQLFSIFVEANSGITLYKRDLRADTAMALARSVWRNNQPLDRVTVVNQNTGSTRDEISRDA